MNGAGGGSDVSGGGSDIGGGAGMTGAGSDITAGSSTATDVSTTGTAADTAENDGFGDEILLAVVGLLFLGLIAWMFTRRPAATTTGVR